MITFTYADNAEAVVKSLEGFEQALADQGPALREVADDFREVAAQQFATEGRAEGTPWAARAGTRARGTGVSPVNTRKMRVPRRPARTMQASPLLVRTGALRDSLTRKGAAAHVETIDSDGLAVGSRLAYAGFHQLGTRRMPARPIIVLSGASGARWTEFVRRAIEQKALLLGKAQLA